MTKFLATNWTFKRLEPFVDTIQVASKLLIASKRPSANLAFKWLLAIVDTINVTVDMILACKNHTTNWAFRKIAAFGDTIQLAVYIVIATSFAHKRLEAFNALQIAADIRVLELLTTFGAGNYHLFLHFSCVKIED